MPVSTIGELAKRFGVERDQIVYVIKSRAIEHVSRAGRYRLYDEAAAKRIGDELQAIRLKREATPCS